jgi:hypothetical protein
LEVVGAEKRVPRYANIQVIHDVTPNNLVIEDVTTKESPKGGVVQIEASFIRPFCDWG